MPLDLAIDGSGSGRPFAGRGIGACGLLPSKRTAACSRTKAERANRTRTSLSAGRAKTAGVSLVGKSENRRADTVQAGLAHRYLVY